MTAFERPSEATLTTGVRSARDPVAVTPHFLASEAALETMRRGGNAVDAAIAANAVQGVVAPETCGIGGDLFALIHEPGMEEPLALNASGRAGSGTSAADLRERVGPELPMRDPATITTPGCVDGWISLSQRLGRLPLAQVLQPAIDLAAEGFRVSQELGSALVRLENLIGTEGSSQPLYPGGTPAAIDATITRRRLGDTLRGVALSGRDAFYAGAVAEAVARATGGILTMDDLSRNNADWVKPISIEVLGQRAWTIPPNTQGYLALAAAWIFERLDPPRDPADPRFVHAAIEAYRAIAWERDDVVSDPTTAPLPPGAVLDPDRLAPFVDTISMDAAGIFPPPTPVPGGTAYMCTRDADGMGVSLIQSNFWGIGSGRSAGDTGVFLHNRGAGFNLIVGHANEFTPGRRPLHTLSPTLWTRQGDLSMILGTRGGQFQPQLILQMIAATLHGGQSPAAAQHAPRWQVPDWEAGSAPSVRLEARTADAVRTGLSDRGHDVQMAAEWESGWGPVSVITESDGLVVGAADPRVTTSAAF